MNNNKKIDILIIGAGPAGLTAGYQLTKKSNLTTVILEEDKNYVGGISRTEIYKGYHFDIGGHRFFSKSKEVVDLWKEILPNDLLKRPRKSRIYYKNKFYNYPLRAFEALFNLGIFQSFLCIISYIKARIFPNKNPKNFQEWVSNKFGKRLFKIFFKSYTEKVWGMKCNEISANWASQRIKDLNMFTVIFSAIKNTLNISSTYTPTTLIKSFYYPRKGPGMLWEEAAKKIKMKDGQIIMGSKVVNLQYLETNEWIVSYKKDNKIYEIIATHVISSMPIKDLMISLVPKASSIKFANNLKYRDFISVALIINKKDIFDDNWIYIHDPNVFVGRIQNYKAWSEEMIPDNSTTCLGLEFFCNEGDDFWNKSNEQLLEISSKELEYLNLVDKNDIIDGCVVRQKKAYPVYDAQYQDDVDEIKKEIKKKYTNIHLIGRNGMHKYNNQDHAMMTALLTVENILRKKEVFDIWNVNEEAEYIEAGYPGAKDALVSLRETPKKIN